MIDGRADDTRLHNLGSIVGLALVAAFEGAGEIVGRI
jgi:hypothetical protein